MDDDELTQEELDGARGDFLPEREAMSLLTPDPMTVYPAPDGELPAFAGETSGGATGAADQASGLADAEGSATSPESATDADRSEHFSASDSASAG